MGEIIGALVALGSLVFLGLGIWRWRKARKAAWRDIGIGVAGLMIAAMIAPPPPPAPETSSARQDNRQPEPSSQPSGDEQYAEKATDTPPANKHASDDAARKKAEEECRKDIVCWGDRHLPVATPLCQRAIERSARYGAEWTDGWTELKFPRFVWKDKERGWLTYRGDKVSFRAPNGLLVPMRYECDYDPTTRQVISVRVQPR